MRIHLSGPLYLNILPQVKAASQNVRFSELEIENEKMHGFRFNF